MSSCLVVLDGMLTSPEQGPVQTARGVLHKRHLKTVLFLVLEQVRLVTSLCLDEEPLHTENLLSPPNLSRYVYVSQVGVQHPLQASGSSFLLHTFPLSGRAVSESSGLKRHRCCSQLKVGIKRSASSVI